MGSDDADNLARAFRAVIRERLRASPAERTLLTELARWVLAEAEQVEQSAGDLPAPATEPPQPPQPPPPPQPRGVVPLSIGGMTVRVEVPGSAGELSAAASAAPSESPDLDEDQGPAPEVDLALLATRSRLKAESCRHFILRREVEGDPVRERGVLETMNQMIARAKALPDCFLWAFWPHADQPDDGWLRRIADCYEALAEAGELCRAATVPDSLFTLDETRQAFQWLAEISSALRIALGQTWLTSPDRDQDESHQWLRRETAARRIFVPRHMVLDDPGDPDHAAEVLDEIRAFARQLEARKASAKRVEQLFKRARYHAERLPAEGTGEAHDLEKINACVAELIELGVGEKDRRFASLRSVIRPGVFPEGAPPHPALIAPIRPEPEEPESGPAPRWSDRVIEVRALLRSGSVVVIGGERRPDAVERMKSAFELAEVEWIPLTEHGTGTPMRAPIARPETRLVLVLIKLCGHLHSEEARAYARAANKPCVIMPAGYNPEQIAEQVLQQASGVLTTG